MANEPIITFHDVTKSFDGFNALEGINLAVARGSIHGIIGTSGAGKSTLLRTINGLERATRGSVEVLGQDPSRLGRKQLSQLRRSVPMVFQADNLLGSKTVAENVAMPLVLAGEKNAARSPRVAEVLGLVGLGDRAEHYPSQLSGGQRQRAGIARALVTNPQVVLCDEPTSALDPVTTTQILALLSEINTELGITIVIITHQMSVVARLADWITVLDAGAIVEAAPARDIFMRPQAPVTKDFVGSAAPQAPGGDEGEQHAYPRVIRVSTTHAPQDILSSVAQSANEAPALIRADSFELRAEVVHNLTLGLSRPFDPTALNDEATTAEEVSTP
ncbi:methionine ABC transporter ATP-binding protein [Corynebacterium auris]|uniref:methionine ABC transporter ATP-binding protein n=1 Tax=Corynebacterium auris TaxID=44750 RepID=UPI0025B2EDB7|nr:ATP-binding cassette domain-containing protein [Corynebacterium auris]WJY67027.1 Methionine import ATP-binding protein MetN 2 [Corynebacterium auris]